MATFRSAASIVILGVSTANLCAGYNWSENFDALPLGAYSNPFWTPLPGTLPGGIAVTDATSVSAPNSLMFDPSLIGPGTPNQNSIEAGMVFDPGLSFTATTWCIEFDVRRDEATDDSLFELVAYDANGGRRGLIAIGDYGIGPSVINISFGSPFAEANLPYTWGEWIHIEWEINFYGNGSGFQYLTVDDYPYSFLPMGSFDTPITAFGFVFRDPAGEYSGTAYVDNLSFTAIPAPGAIVLLAAAGMVGGRRRR